MKVGGNQGTSQPVPGAGHPFGYFSRETMEAQDDEDVTRMVAWSGMVMVAKVGRPRPTVP